MPELSALLTRTLKFADCVVASAPLSVIPGDNRPGLTDDIFFMATPDTDSAIAPGFPTLSASDSRNAPVPAALPEEPYLPESIELFAHPDSQLEHSVLRLRNALLLSVTIEGVDDDAQAEITAHAAEREAEAAVHFHIDNLGFVAASQLIRPPRAQVPEMPAARLN